MPLPRPAVHAVSPVPPQPYEDLLPHQIVSSDLEEPVQAIVQFASHLTDSQRERLAAVLQSEEDGSPPVEYGAGFDIAYEVEQQIIAVRAIRDKAVGRDGRVKEGIGARELSGVVSSGSTLLNALLKHNDQIKVMRRFRLLEKSIIEALREVDPAVKDQVMALFEEKLGAL